jgi:predicted nucleic acid-binding protein
MSPNYIAIDTNIFISAALSPNGIANSLNLNISTSLSALEIF